MSIDDYFVKNCYEGEIYKTVNLKNLAINQYCKDSTEVKKEQEKIEKELKDFRKNLWNSPAPIAAPADTATAANDSVAAPAEKEKKAPARSTKKKETKKKSETKSKSSSKSSGGTISVRRTRR